LDRICEFIARSGWGVRALQVSPLLGADGNREFFVHLRPRGEGLDRGLLEREMRRALETEE
jgi:hypothetical protein